MAIKALLYSAEAPDQSPDALIGGIMGMNFELGFFGSGTSDFLIVTGSMVVLSAAAIWVARKRSWIA